jgi:hypothetical protein
MNSKDTKRVINLISERSRLIQDELDQLDPESENYELMLEILSAQLSLLDEIYNEATKLVI